MSFWMGIIRGILNNSTERNVLNMLKDFFTPERIIVFLSLTLLVFQNLRYLADAKRSIKAPEQKQNERLDKLESEMKKVNAYLDNDKRRLDSLERSNRVMLRGMSALLAHGINAEDVNAINEMEKVRDELQDLLYERQ